MSEEQLAKGMGEFVRFLELVEAEASKILLRASDMPSTRTTVDMRIECPRCNGKGYVPDLATGAAACPTCYADGGILEAHESFATSHDVAWRVGVEMPRAIYLYDEFAGIFETPALAMQMVTVLNRKQRPAVAILRKVIDAERAAALPDLERVFRAFVAAYVK